VTANEYNPFSYHVFPTLYWAKNLGFEIGLHSNFLEFATITGVDPYAALKAEISLLRSFFPAADSISCHRDINYQFNSLPWLEAHWQTVKSELRLAYQAYEPRVLDNVLYVNEGLNPHLCWRKQTPEDAIKTGKSICLLTHSHWWYEKHPYEFPL
jgi:hypothetical protein